MTKYFVCINQPNSGQVNVPGSREEMACNIAMVASQFEKPKDFYIAYHSSNPQSTWEALKEQRNIPWKLMTNELNFGRRNFSP